MAKVIAISWRSHPNIHLLVGDARGGRVRVELLATLALPDTADAEAARELIAQALGRSAHSAARVVGLVGRTQAVLRDLRVPTAPANELPGIVRYQAMRELSFSPEEAAVDFDVVETLEPAGQQRVILVALQQDVVERYCRAIPGPKLRLNRLTLRPYATWRAFQELAENPAQAALVISLAGESLELTIGRGTSVLFSRATLLRANGDDGAPAGDHATVLAGEVRRTLAAFAHQMPQVEVRQIALAAGPDEHEQLTAALASQLALPVHRFDPLDAVEIAPDQHAGCAGAHGTYAAVIGAALGAAEPWPIDFINPKKAIEPKDWRKPIAILAAAAALVIGSTGYLVAHTQHAKLDGEIQRLLAEQNTLKETLKAAEEVLREYQAIEEWAQAETDCLEELRRLSEEYPETDQMYTTGLTFTRGTAETGRIMLEGVARQRAPISEFHTKLNTGEHYTAQPIGTVQQNARGGDFRWSFSSSIAVRPPAAAAEADLPPGSPPRRPPPATRISESRGNPTTPAAPRKTLRN